MKDICEILETVIFLPPILLKYQNKNLLSIDTLGLALQKFSLFEFLSMVDTVHDIFGDVYLYVIDNCKWNNYTNAEKIPNSVLNNTHDIERCNSQCGIMLKKSSRLSDESLENVLMSATNRSLQWIDNIQINKPIIFEFVKNSILNDSFRSLRDEVNDKNNELHEKRLQYHSNKLKKRKFKTNLQTSNNNFDQFKENNEQNHTTIRRPARRKARINYCETKNIYSDEE